MLVFSSSLNCPVQGETERKRQKLSGRSDCEPASVEDEETSTKRPKLMEADELASMHDPQTSSIEVSIFMVC